MKAILKARPAAGVELSRQHPEPEIGPDDVLVKVAATSICGTDVHLYHWDKSAQAFNMKLPHVIGHEVSGEVVKVGAAVQGLKGGDRVAAESHIYCGACYMCRTGYPHNCENLKLLGLSWPGAFADYVPLPAKVCFPLPQALPLEVGALFEPSGVAMHAIQRAGNLDGMNVLVSGAGPIGLVLTQLAYLMGATRVVALEPNPFRRKLAEKYGARAYDPLASGFDIESLARSSEFARHGGFDVAFEVSAAQPAIETCLRAVRREASIVCIGHPNEPIALDVATYITKKMVIVKGIFGRRIWDTWEQLLSFVETKRLDLAGLITHRLGMEEFDQGIALLKGESGKVLISPN